MKVCIFAVASTVLCVYSPGATAQTTFRTVTIAEAVNEAVSRLADAGVLTQITVGRRNRAFEAAELIDAFADLERQLASPEGETNFSMVADPTNDHLVYISGDAVNSTGNGVGIVARGDAFAEKIDRVTHGRRRAGASTTHPDERKVHLLREVRDLLRRCHVPGAGLVEAADLGRMQRSLNHPLEHRPELLG